MIDTQAEDTTFHQFETQGTTVHDDDDFGIPPPVTPRSHDHEAGSSRATPAAPPTIEPALAAILSHPALRNKARCISYMRQEDNIYNNRVYRDKCHKTSEYLLHSGRLITK
jgi:hypothetical protein